MHPVQRIFLWENPNISVEIVMDVSVKIATNVPLAKARQEKEYAITKFAKRYTP